MFSFTSIDSESMVKKNGESIDFYPFYFAYPFLLHDSLNDNHFVYYVGYVSLVADSKFLKHLF
jgi:hypothetical protein